MVFPGRQILVEEGIDRDRGGYKYGYGDRRRVRKGEMYGIGEEKEKWIR